jgi:hypothetical protein
MKIKWKPRLHKNRNDCWNDAIALAINKSYDEVRESVKNFIDENGSLEGLIIDGILLINDYKIYEYKFNSDMTVSQFIRFHNTNNNHCVLSLETPEGSHSVYIHKNTIYDNEEVENRGQYYDYIVKQFLMKESD